ncbi:MAG: D-2-hydroxyacid dehydrogenase [Eubacterium sp.]|nr:D-2-hydroxyacid dehydrogenase [Eubacterium sp.]
MNIVFLDADTIGKDIDLTVFEKFGNVTIYGFSTQEEMRERVIDADILILNKMLANSYTLEKASHLKLICVTATGTNNLDKEYLQQRGIAWRNVAGYSTECVTQHTFAMLFYLLEKLPYYDNYVKSEAYINNTTFTHFNNIFHEIHGMTWGIIGLGAIGQRVAQIASLFGCRVIYYSTTGKNNQPDYTRVSFEELLAQSDIISVHAPLTEQTEGLMNRAAFQQMKQSAIFLNLGRGPIVAEQDLADALQAGELAAAGLDVLSVEPMCADHPLKSIKDSGKLLITPHIAWAGAETRRRLMDIIQDQIAAFIHP